MVCVTARKFDNLPWNLSPGVWLEKDITVISPGNEVQTPNQDAQFEPTLESHLASLEAGTRFIFTRAQR